MLSVHRSVEVQSEEAFDIRFLHALYLKALLGDDLLDTVGALEDLFWFQSFASCDEEELSGSCHFHLNAVEEVHILFEQTAHLRIVFLCESALQVCLVIVKAFGGVGAGDLDVGDRRQYHHQMAHLDLNVHR